MIAELLRETLDNIKMRGLEYFGRFYSSYRGIVVSNDDDEYKGRIKVKVPSIFDDKVLPDFAYPKSMWAGPGHGVFFPPIPGSGVWISFECGDPNYPIYEGGWWAKEKGGELETPSEFRNESPKTYGIVTPNGHALLYNDKDGEESVTVRWKDGDGNTSKIHFSSDGAFSMEDKNGNLIQTSTDSGNEIKIQDANENKVKTDSSGIMLIDQQGAKVSLEGLLIKAITQGNIDFESIACNLGSLQVNLGKQATEPLVLGTQLSLWWATQVMTTFQAHTHLIVVPVPGLPTSPAVTPIAPMTPQVLSTVSKTQ